MKPFKYILSILIPVLIVSGVVYATSNLTPPGSVTNTMYTLGDIYSLAVSRTGAVIGSGAIPATPGAVETTFHTLTEVYNAVANLIASISNGYPSTGWTPNAGTVGVDPGTTPLTKSVCDAAGTISWAWFADANGDGDTTDPEDGMCVQTASSTGLWNGATLVAGTSLITQTATGVSTSTITKTGAVWTVDNYKNDSVKITNGTASACWGIIKTNTSDTITIYGNWLAADHTTCASMPTGTPTFIVNLENYQDNTWIGDYTCTGNFPTGTVVWHNYPTATQAGVNNVALASADCYDGKRDLLPTETDRAVVSGTITSLATTSTTTTITDSALTSSPVSANDFIGQEVLITSGTGINSTSTIEWNTTNSFTVNTWSSTTPDVGSTYKVIYIIPFAGSTAGTQNLKYKGPLTIEALKAWKGTRLPTSMDFWGYCGAKTGDAYNSVGDGLYHASGASDKTAIGLLGVNAGRGKNSATGNDNYLYMSNYGSYEWLSEQNYLNGARYAGYSACSYVHYLAVYTSNRFRGVFRP